MKKSIDELTKVASRFEKKLAQIFESKRTVYGDVPEELRADADGAIKSLDEIRHFVGRHIKREIEKSEDPEMMGDLLRPFEMLIAQAISRTEQHLYRIISAYQNLEQKQTPPPEEPPTKI